MDDPRLESDLVPCADIRVRRRRIDQRTVLLFRDLEFELDVVADTVWLECESGRSVEEIAQMLSGQGLCKQEDALSRVLALLAYFESEGLLRWRCSPDDLEL